MAKYEWSEVFFSIEGEAKYSGHPTAYVRFARCNFQCALFNNPNKEVEKDGYATLTFNPKDYTKLEDIPLIHTGCDSQYAVNPAFAHMWHKGDENHLAQSLLETVPNKTLTTPFGKPIIISLTGGEPTIRIKFWIPLLELLHKCGMRHIIVETNCSAPLRQKDVDALYEWTVPHLVKVTWSNSPKLSVSGETWDTSIRPEIAKTQRTYTGTSLNVREFFRTPEFFDQYFKFVCDPSLTHFEEVRDAMDAYFYNGGVPRESEVYIMPTACTEEQQQEVAARVAKMCMDFGWIYCHRIQNSVFGNGVGT